MARGNEQRGEGGQRRGRDRGAPAEERAESDIVEKLVHINRVAATVKGGRRFSFAALMVVGDQKLPGDTARRSRMEVGLGHEAVLLPLNASFELAEEQLRSVSEER